MFSDYHPFRSEITSDERGDGKLFEVVHHTYSLGLHTHLLIVVFVFFIDIINIYNLLMYCIFPMVVRKS